jgi:hypothetical protein
MLWRSDTPWYDSARLFRQPMAGQWAGVLKTIASELHLLLSGRGRRLEG